VTVPAVLVLTLTLDELRALMRETLDAALAAHAPSMTPLELVDRRELARLLVVAPVTITRLTAEGLPCTYVGESPRYDVVAVRAWLDARGRHGTKAKASKASIGGVRLLSRGLR
jgi:hypothetical protein